MPILIEGIQCLVHCGVTSVERRQPQPIVIDLELRCANSHAAHSDELLDTVDYGKIVSRVSEIATTSRFCLLEALADLISQTLFQEFPISQLDAWVRKTDPPLDHIKGSVGVRLSHTRPPHAHRSGTTFRNPEVSQFFLQQFGRLQGGKILDIATGSGRHALFLASRGYTVVGIDRNAETLAHVQQAGSEIQNGHVTTSCLDLEADPGNPPDLGDHEYDGILVFFYLYRPLFPRILQALKSGGILIYETFLIDNHIVHHHPRHKEFCLQHNELLQLTTPLRVLQYEEGASINPHSQEQTFTARLVAQKP
ncbi:MAG: dihydroneopterin aldolase [Nitrospirales bacterium]|nr:dihydroneopterin aldolase [Nitrospira sp.]MDR4501969.1 dihydroneopterin aldolase [Nitrospirales bacterium]